MECTLGVVVLAGFFVHFAGLLLYDVAPGHAAVCRFRSLLAEAMCWPFGKIAGQ